MDIHYAKLEPLLEQCLEQIKSKNTTGKPFVLHLSGHSLGGAVATIGATRLVSLGVDPQQL